MIEKEYTLQLSSCSDENMPRKTMRWVRTRKTNYAKHIVSLPLQKQNKLHNIYCLKGDKGGIGTS